MLTETNEFIASANRYFVVNPVAGHGVPSDATILNDESINIHMTSSDTDCREYVCEVCKKDPNAWIIVCGGDGTISEAVSGILDAGCGRTAALSAIPTGSGNDFVRYMNSTCKQKEIYDVDAIKIANHYCVNMVNIGFDCDVVAEARKMKQRPWISGSFAYILGVVKALVKKKSFKTIVQLNGVNGTDENETFEGNYLLTALSGCPYCGGGFKAHPLASPFDGLIDVLLIDNVTRMKFIKLVGDYRAGTHFDEETGKPAKKVEDIITYRRCKSISYGGFSQICIDGEIVTTDSINAEIIPNAFRYINPLEEWTTSVKSKKK